MLNINLFEELNKRFIQRIWFKFFCTNCIKAIHCFNDKYCQLLRRIFNAVVKFSVATSCIVRCCICICSIPLRAYQIVIRALRDYCNSVVLYALELCSLAPELFCQPAL